MNAHDIGIGTKLELELINKSGIKSGKIYTSQVIDIIDGESFLLSCPIIKSKYVFFDIDTDINAVFIDRDSNCCYSFMAQIGSKEKVDSILALKVSIVSGFEKIQRRNFYRLEYCTEASYSIHQQSEPDEMFLNMIPEKDDCKKALTKNISGNGACLVTDEKILPGTAIDIELKLGKKEKFKIKSKVVRSGRIEGIPYEKYETAICFANILPEHQERVVKFIHDRQRILLSRRRLNSKAAI